MRKNKDEKLNELFRECLSSGKMPDERVTENARRLLEEREQEYELSAALAPAAAAQPSAPVHAGDVVDFTPAAAGAGRGAPRISPLRKREVVILAAVLGCVLLLAAVYFLTQLLYPAANIVFDRTQLSKVTQDEVYTEKDFLPFVKENSVLKYEEFGFSEESPYYEEYADDIILYYLQFESYGVTVDMLIEIDGFTLEELEKYLEIENEYEADDFMLYLEVDEIEECSYVYFFFDIYQYYLEIHTADFDLLAYVLDDIIYSF